MDILRTILRTIDYNGNKREFVGMIGCVRLSDLNTAPEGQRDCGHWNCDRCNAVMWSSDKKRQLFANHSEDFVKVCMRCSIQIMVENGIKPDMQAVIDLSKPPN